MRVWFIVFVALLLATETRADTRPANQPNMIIIYTDDVGFGDVGCYGAKGVKTPHIDRLAKEGLRFTDAHCSAATCTPSRYTLLTGTYAFRNPKAKILRGDAPLIISPQTPTLASTLKKAGYQTGVVGKWHLGLGNGKVDWNQRITPGPAEIGFDYHFLIPATGDRVPCVYVEHGKVVDHDPADPIQTSYGKKIGNQPTGKDEKERVKLKQNWSHGHNASIVNGISRIGFMTGGKKARWVDEDMADVISHKAVEFIRKSKDEPFFLFFSTHDIHVPRVPHSRFVGKSKMGLRGDAIVQMDFCVGEVLKTLDELKLTKKTLIMFTSDNGPVLDDGYVDQANEKLDGHLPSGKYRGGKYSCFEGGTRVPTIVRYPGVIKAGKTSAALVGQVDFAATLTKIGGGLIPETGFTDSRDAKGTLLGTSSRGRDHLIHEANKLALRSGNWKYIPPGGRTREKLGPWKWVKIPPTGFLFDLASDAAETHNLAKSNPRKTKEMADLLEKIRKAPDR